MKKNPIRKIFHTLGIIFWVIVLIVPAVIFYSKTFIVEPVVKPIIKKAKYENFHNEYVYPIQKQISETIIYKSDYESHGVNDLWQTPELTMRIGTGDCEDFTILLAYNIYKKTGVKPKMHVGYNNDESGHAWLAMEGRDYEATTTSSGGWLFRYAYEFKYPIDKYYTYDEIMKKAKKDSEGK